MQNDLPDPARPRNATDAARMFGVAWVFLVCAMAIGWLLRVYTVAPVGGVKVGNFLHAHSHVAFLGWVFNAFFALAMRFFVREADGRFFRRLFWAMQVPVLGMLVAYPIQGYARWSIAASALHVAAAVIFAVKLWMRAEASGVTRRYLRAALFFMVASNAGPLALGPLAAAGLRDSPWYTLAIYFYMHGQYNGWFVFFPLAVVTRRIRGRAGGSDAENAWKWLVPGAALTFALSTLWLDPPAGVRAVAAGGGVLQLVGTIYFFRGIGRSDGGARTIVGGGLPGLLMATAAAAYLAKVILQLAPLIPALSGVTWQRPVAIAFLHLVFLGVVIPFVFSVAIEGGWIKLGARVKLGLVAYFCGAAWTGWLLGCQAFATVFGLPLHDMPVAEGLAIAAGAMVGGVLLLCPHFGKGQTTSE